MARRFVARPPAPNFSSQYVKIRGLREYQQKLDALGDGMADHGCVYALAGGIDQMRDAVRARVPVLRRPDPRRRAGTLRNAIQALRSSATKYAVTYVAGIRLLSGRAIRAFKRKTGKGARDNPSDPFYGPVLEYGKTPRTRHPFIRPGFQAAGEAALRTSADRLRTFTLGEIKRLAAQA